MSKEEKEYQFSWHSSITSIPEDAWNRCFKNSPTYNSYTYQKALENSAITDIVFHYITAKKNNTILAIVTCFEYKASLDIFATSSLSLCINFARKFYKKFLILKGFFAGHLTSVCDHTFGFDSCCDIKEKILLLNAIGNQIIVKSKQVRAHATFIKEIFYDELSFFKDALDQSFIFTDSLPNAILSLNHNLPYYKQIRSKYRKLLKKRVKQFNDAGLTWEIHNNCNSFVSVIEKMYLEQLSEATHKFEVLNGNYFNYISNQMPDAFFILAKKQNEILGFGFYLLETNSLKTLYLGYNKQYKDVFYFNIFYRLIEEAFIQGKRHLLLGQTTYEFKQSLGAILSRVYLGFHSHNKFILFIIKNFRNLIFPKTKAIIRNVWNKK